MLDARNLKIVSNKYEKTNNKTVYITKPTTVYNTKTTLDIWPGACTTMVAEQTQGYRIRFELTKPNQSNPALLIINFLCQLRLNPKLMERM